MEENKYTNHEIGELGEKLAKKFLEEREYKIISQNFRCKQGEIDIIAKDQLGILVFVEVKTRTSLIYGYPAEAVNERKVKHIINAARYYLQMNKLNDSSIRFDIIEVFICKGRYRVNHIKQIM